MQLDQPPKLQGKRPCERSGCRTARLLRPRGSLVCQECRAGQGTNKGAGFYGEPQITTLKLCPDTDHAATDEDGENDASMAMLKTVLRLVMTLWTVTVGHNEWFEFHSELRA